MKALFEVSLIGGGVHKRGQDSKGGNYQPYLQDHPRTRKWLIPMVCKSPKSPKDRVVGPLPNGRNGL